MSEEIKNAPNKELVLRESLAIQRTKMANQTTLLSFIRTALYFLVAGLSIENLITISNSLFFEIFFFSCSLALVGIGLYNYFINKKFIEENKKNIGQYQYDYLNEL
jgi:putative membrane protein